MSFNEEAAFGDHGPPPSQTHKPDIDKFLSSFEFKIISILPIVVIATLINVLLGTAEYLITWIVFMFFTGLLYYKGVRAFQNMRIRIQAEEAVKIFEKQQDN